MKRFQHQGVPHARLRAQSLLLAAAVLPLLLAARSTAFAGSAQWNLNPGSGDWNTSGNWTPTTVPNAAADTATFDVSNTNAVSLSVNTEVNGITFNAGASAFTITAPATFQLTISGTGITNNSGMTQNFVTNGAASNGIISFTNSATAGINTAFTNNGGTVSGGVGGKTLFSDTSTAGSATLTNNGSTVTSFGAFGGFTQFFGSSTAGSATLIANGGTVSFANGGLTQFQGASTAGNGTLIANGGTGGGQGGAIRLVEGSTGGTARVEVFGNGNLDISGNNAPGVTIGSIEGTGNVFLGARNLTVGSNNLSTTFSGVISNTGSLTKTGSGTQTLSGAGTYTGGTTINAGTLLVNNTSGSGTGSGSVQVNAGTLGGTGTIASAVTIGTGSGPGAVLSPGLSPGTLIIQGALTLNSDATYKFELNSSTATADKVVANGVTINGALFSAADLGNGTLAPGTGFTVIDDTAVSPITGTFSNLPDGSMFTANGNTFLVSYEGGDGNDLTIEAVPEPSTWAAGLLTAGAIICSIWRRRTRWLSRSTHAR